MNATAYLLPLSLLTPLSFANAQAPSVLTLQKSYHVGVYQAEVDSPSGALKLRANVGDMDLTASESYSGSFDVLEIDATGSTSQSNQPFAGEYFVLPGGEMLLDFEPGPAVDLVPAWTNTSGSVIHTTRPNLTTDTLTMIALEKGSGLNNATLSGTYYYVSHRIEQIAGIWETATEWGTATFDGSGAGIANGTEQQGTATGITTTPTSNGFPYAVGSDGALTLGSSVGGVSADGEVLFAVIREPASGEIGMTVAVRIGASYDFNDVPARCSLTGQSFELGTGPGKPQVTSSYTQLQLAATSTTTGTWQIEGINVDSNEFGHTPSLTNESGTATLSGSGELTLSNLGGSLELAISANGDFLVGRVVQNENNLLFGMRQCGFAGPYGTATAGTGGVEPAIGMKTFPTIGNPNWNLTIANSRGATIAAMAVSFAELPGIPALGGVIWVDPTGAYLPLLVLDGAAGAAGAGSGQTPVLLPNDPAIVGTELFAQALVIDPAAPEGIAMSSGFRATICD